ncbi:MAG: arginine--tRNA ligase [Candidatus Buchananbacteria bacterium]|nr:arginine--tRNA ligase [Candidatus Buchananbacteria bacterium]
MKKTLSPSYSRAEKTIRHEIASLLKAVLGPDFKTKLVNIEYPPDNQMGDYSVPCFLLAKKLKQSPQQIASELAIKIKPTKIITQVQALGPYLNFVVDKTQYHKMVLQQIVKEKEDYGSSKVGKGKKVMIEYFSPNTNKPLTVGHLRNICLGYSMTEILRFVGYKVITATIYNDRGIALAKTILAYQKWGNKKTPKDLNQKPDHFVGELYTRYGRELKENPELEKEAQKVLRQWEDGQKEVKTIWQNLVEWVLIGYQQTLKELEIPDFDEKYHESEYYKLGQEIVQEGLKRGVFKKHQEGYVYADLEKYGLPNKILLRSDGTSLYITQDLYLAELKNKYQLDASIIVSGAEQDLQFKQLFQILKLIDDQKNVEYFHLSHGMMRLPTGRIKSREGLVKGTAADDLINDLNDLALAEIKKREPELDEKELQSRAKKISLAALKFFILAVDAKNTMVFDPKKSLAFTGKTGPYLQYVYARINSIFNKAEVKIKNKVDFDLLVAPEEIALIKILARFSENVFLAAQTYNPSLISTYLFDLAKAFSGFYEKVPVAKAEVKLKNARLLLISCVSQVLANGLNLLGIETIEKM